MKTVSHKHDHIEREYHCPCDASGAGTSHEKARPNWQQSADNSERDPSRRAVSRCQPIKGILVQIRLPAPAPAVGVAESQASPPSAVAKASRCDAFLLPKSRQGQARH